MLVKRISYRIKSSSANNQIAGSSGTKNPAGSIKGKGAYNGYVRDGRGFGKLADKEIGVSQKGIDIVKEHYLEISLILQTIQ